MTTSRVKLPLVKVTDSGARRSIAGSEEPVNLCGERATYTRSSWLFMPVSPTSQQLIRGTRVIIGPIRQLNSDAPM